jgi:hypothetical protein
MEWGCIVVENTIEWPCAFVNHFHKKPKYSFITVESDNIIQFPEQDNYARRQPGKIPPSILDFV